MSIMQSYNSFLKSFLKLVAVITIVPTAIIILFYIGFALDFGGYNKGDTVGYMLVLPAAFIGILAYSIYVSGKRKKQQEFQSLKQQARSEVLSEGAPNQTAEASILSLLSTKGPLSAVQMSSMLGIEHNHVLDATRNLLAEKSIVQKITDTEAIFSTTRKG